jgi:hypothetical protein
MDPFAVPTASINVGSGHSTSTTHTPTRVTIDNLTLHAGEADLKGTQVTVRTARATIDRDLKLASTQNTTSSSAQSLALSTSGNVRISDTASSSATTADPSFIEVTEYLSLKVGGTLDTASAGVRAAAVPAGAPAPIIEIEAKQRVHRELTDHNTSSGFTANLPLGTMMRIYSQVNEIQAIRAEANARLLEQGMSDEKAFKEVQKVDALQGELNETDAKLQALEAKALEKVKTREMAKKSSTELTLLLALYSTICRYHTNTVFIKY